jgi:ribosomal-protein-alanine N-acetyltransferase
MTMPPIPELRTERLVLRRFLDDDLDRWNELLFADPEVRRYLPIGEPLSAEQLAASLARGRAHWATHGYGTWAVADAVTSALVGHCGLRYLDDLGETEVLYGFGRAFWGRGYATEAVRAALDFGFSARGLTRIVAFVVPENVASRHVVERLGMLVAGEVDVFGLRCVRYAIERSPPGA